MTSVSTDRRQGVNSGAAIKIPVRAATTANITLNGLQTVDGIVLAADDRVLVKNQTDQTQNGIYYADTGDWTRTEDFDGYFDVLKGTLVYVNSGTVGAQLCFAVSSADPVTIDTSNITFTLAGLLYTPVYVGDGTVGAPSMSFLLDQDTGWYRIGANNMGGAVAGAKVLDISATGLGVTGTLTTTSSIAATGAITSGGTITSTGVILGPTGAVGAPALSFSTDPDTGVYRIGANNLGIATGGVKVIDVGSSGLTALTCPTSGTTVLNLNQTHASAPFGMAVVFTADPNGTSNYFFQGTGNGTERCTLRSNGGLANFSGNNANLSDGRLKKDIADAPSYYEVFKALRLRTFKYKDQTDDIPTLGVIAQELEQIAPELVDQGGWGRKEIPLLVDGKEVHEERPVLDENDIQRVDLQPTEVLAQDGTPILREVPRTSLQPVMVENPNFAPDGVPLKAIYQTDFQFATARALQETIIALEALRADFAEYKKAHP